MTLDTDVGHGATVRVYLPASDQALESTPATSPHESHGGTIVVVDINAAVRELVARALRPRGYSVSTVSNPAEAWESIERQGAPDLLITEVDLAGTSGPDLASRLVHRFPQLRVLFLTAQIDETVHAPESRWYGAPLLHKPFTLAQLGSRVRRALSDL